MPNPLEVECFRPDGLCISPIPCGDAERCLWHSAPREEPLPTTPPDLVRIRPDRDDLFMQIAYLVSTRSTCLRGHVGAVVVRDKRIISMGYNGAPPGQPHCLDVGCDELTLYDTTDLSHDDWTPVELGCQRAIHAEANALAWAARYGVSTDEATMYATHSPCPACARLCVSAGICKYVYDKAYRVREGIDVLDHCNVEVIQHP